MHRPKLSQPPIPLPPQEFAQVVALQYRAFDSGWGEANACAVPTASAPTARVDRTLFSKRIRVMVIPPAGVGVAELLAKTSSAVPVAFIM